jgi:DNA-binding response OmpR family regulator
VLSARGDELDIVRAFRYGADDVMVQPVRYAELRARIAALLRRADPHRAGHLIRVAGLEIDTRARRVALDGALLELTQREYALLVHLAAEPDRVFNKDDLVRAVWGQEAFGASRTLDSHACRLRDKLCRGGDRSWVINVWGVGYALRQGSLGEAA